MYIYELPFQVNVDLCRLLDHDDDWKELAGVHMMYSAFDVNEIEQESKRHTTSPTNILFVRWGQLNHRVEELFILLHRMKHVPAMRCLAPVVDERFHRLLKKDSLSLREPDTAALEESNKKKQSQRESESSLPLPVMLIEKGVQLPSSSNVLNIRSPKDSTTSGNDSSETTDRSCKDDEFLKVVSAIPMLSYEDLQKATGDWNDRNLLGKGGFGQVYKGEWKLLPVAVKRLRGNDGKNKELIREMCLNQYRHDNILPLYGYSLGGPEACLVYQLMPGGSLEQRLRRRTRHAALSWPQRHRVAHGVARGLQYLHTMAGTPLIHGDIKPANILLDQCTIPKIGDFGLARKGPYGEERSHLKVSQVHGTRPYLPEDYLSSHCLSPAVDVYSYGVLVLELATAQPVLSRPPQPALGRPPAAGEPAARLADRVTAAASAGGDLAVLEDPILAGTPQSNPDLCRQFCRLGIACTKAARRERPSMLLVYKHLDSLSPNFANFEFEPKDMRA